VSKEDLPVTDRPNRRGFFGAIAAALALPAFVRRAGVPVAAAKAVVPDILDPELDWDRIIHVLYQAHGIDPDRARDLTWPQVMRIVNRGKPC
jgi:hypothetical protein